MPNRLPYAAWLLGLAGLLPFVACALVAVGSPHGVQSDHGMAGLIAYGAVILSFLGGIHWGFALGPLPYLGMPNLGSPAPASAATAEASRAIAARLTLGVLPSLIGWLALIAFIMLSASAALAVLIVGFLLTIGGEHRLWRGGHFPRGYMAMRAVLTVVVTLCLATVLTVSLIGAKIEF